MIFTLKLNVLHDLTVFPSNYSLKSLEGRDHKSCSVFNGKYLKSKSVEKFIKSSG